MRIYLLFFSTLFSNICFAQWGNHKYINLEPATLVTTYSLHIQEDSTNQNNISKAKFLLFIGANVSEFVHLYKFINDTAIRRFTTDDQVISYLSNSQANIPNALYRIYKNYPKGKLTFTDHIPSDTYRYEEPLDIFNWQLTGDTATVCGYKSQKATCNFGGRSWVAWFAPELPYSDGPYKFNGLPGLILKIADTRNHYVFEMTEIQKPGEEVMIDIEDKNYIVTTKQGFFRAFDSFINDFITRARQSGPGNDLQTLAKNLSRRNNPIELLRK